MIPQPRHVRIVEETPEQPQEILEPTLQELIQDARRAADMLRAQLQRIDGLADDLGDPSQPD